MVLKIFRFILGYVRFKIIGEIPERLINQFSANNISVWKIERTENIIKANILAKDYKKIRKIKKQNKVITKIERKYGLPFVLKNYSKRIGVVIGAVVFVIIIAFLSTRVWYIKVEGNNYIKTKIILNTAEQYGLKLGANKSSLDSVKIKNCLLKDIKNLSWIAVNIEGSRVTLKVSENLKTPKKTKTYPCNLVAKKDGVITKLLVKNGVTVVKVNQAVQKGELLVSGTEEYKEGNLEFKHSMGEIFAKTEIELTVKQNLKEKVAYFSGKSKQKTAVSFFGINIPLYLGNITETYQKSTKLKQFKTKDMVLPVFFTTSEFLIIKTKPVIYSRQEALKSANKKLEDLEKIKLKNKEIIEQTENITETEKFVKITKKYICIENIAKQEKIKVNTTNY